MNNTLAAHDLGAVKREIQGAIARAAESLGLQIGQWRPIGSAPQDGTEIIVLDWDGELHFALYQTAEDLANEHGGHPDDYGEGWFTVDGNDVDPRWWIPAPRSP